MRLRLSLSLLLIAASLIAPLAGAQQASSGEFTVQRFAPAPGPRNFITVEGARTEGQSAFSLGLFGHYASNPFVITTCTSATTCGAQDAEHTREVQIVENLFTADLLASYTPFPRLQLGLRVPFTFARGAGINTDLADGSIDRRTRGGLSGTGFGDPMLEAKVRAYGSEVDPYVLGLAVFGTAPVAHGVSSTKGDYIGDSSPTGGLRGIIDAQFGRFGVAANLAGVLRKEAYVGTARLGSEARYGLGGSFQVSPVLSVLAEGFGATRFSSASGTNAFEIDLAARVQPLGSGIVLTAGGGFGVSDGVGVPSGRAFAGVMFVSERGDQDGDRITDERDQCPTAAEDFDGFQDADGCPDPDNDNDGIPDTSDKCPNDAEVKNGYQDSDGCPDDIPDRDKDGISDSEDKCPDEGGYNVIRRQGDFYGCPDRDKDGIVDSLDKCPDQPEDTDGFEDADGCPDPDNDHDGINDIDDQCVDLPEIKNGYQDDDGCPDEVPDSDKDGIVDSLDKCPEAPETYNAYQDDDGCPDKGPATVDVTAEEVRIRDNVNFAPDSDQIVGKKSFQVLDAVASALAHHPEIFKVEVSGHTDNKGDSAHNVDLSQRRANAVMAYLVSKNVDAHRLSSKGYGPDRPIADNKSAQGRAKNRRVAFAVVSSLRKSSQPTEKPAASP